MLDRQHHRSAYPHIREYADTRMCEKHYSHLAPSFIADTIRATAPRFGTTASSENVRTLLVRG